MASSTPAASSALKSIRIALGLSGAVALTVGVLILIWPVKTAVALTLIIAVYAILAGLVYLALGVVGKELTGWGRVWHLVTGVVFIVAGIIAFLNPGRAAAVFAVIVVVFLAISWIMEGASALATAGMAEQKGWTIFFAIVSILAGIAVMFAPMFAAVFFWMWLAFGLIAIGVFQIIRAFTLKPSYTTAA